MICEERENMKNLAPIILFVYNRIEHTRQAVKALLENDLAGESDLYIFSDGPALGEENAVKKVRDYIHHISGFREIHIIERKDNYGIEKSEISAITEILAGYPKVIILEDDLVVAHNFLRYMNDALEKYSKEKKVFYISGYSHLDGKLKRLPDSMLLSMPTTWGWATWKDRWAYFREAPEKSDVEKIINNRKSLRSYDFNGAYYKAWGNMLIDQYKTGQYTWDVSWHVAQFQNNALVLFPNQTLVQNIGFDGSGTHGEMRENRITDWSNVDTKVQFYPDRIEESPKIRKTVIRLMKKRHRIESIQCKLSHFKRKIQSKLRRRTNGIKGC